MSLAVSSPGAESAAWREFAQARSPEEFYRSWLSLQCGMIPGVRAGLIVAGAGGSSRFVPVAVWPEGQPIQHLAEAAERALVERRGLVLRKPRTAVAPASTQPGGTAGGDRIDVGYPIEVDGKLHGAVALELSASRGFDVQAVLRQLQWGAGWLEVLVHRVAALRVDPSSTEGAKLRLQATLELVAGALGHERFHAAATAFATALATRLSCDRVSIGFLKKGRSQVRAVSHSGQFGKQTNVIRAIEAAMDEALDQRATIACPSRTPDACVTRAHAELARQHGAISVCTVPLAEGGRFVGALTLERLTGASFDQMTVEFLEAVAAVSGPILELERRDDRWLLVKAAERGRRYVGYLVGPRHVALKLTAASALGAALFLAFATGDYRVSARTIVEARVQRAAVAPFNGYIREAPARAGDVVRAGQVLATLDDRELELQRLRWLSQQEQLVREYQQALARREAAQTNIVAAQLDQVRAQLALVEEQLSRTRVVAPFDGFVVTGDLTQSLNAPVERGEVLFEIAPLAEYRIVVQVDEREIAGIEVGQRGQLLLAAWPTDVLPFSVTRLTPVSMPREGRNYFRVEGTLDAVPEGLRPGMEGVAKITIGRRSLAWIWTREAIDWGRLKVWTWLP